MTHESPHVRMPAAARRPASPARLPARSPALVALGLQRTAGNRALASVIRRACDCGTCERCQAKRGHGHEDAIVPSNGFLSGKGSGEPLAGPVRDFMETRFGQDFGGVRVHTDAHAARSAREISALAYTAGSDIFFAPGHFQPDTASGRHLLAHELTHVIQQGSGAVTAQAQLTVGPADDAFEREADRVADAVTAQGAPPAAPAVTPFAAGTVQRKRCVTGSFSRTGKGVRAQMDDAARHVYLKPTWDGARGKFGHKFQIDAEFKPVGDTKNCEAGEYRQFLHGVSRCNDLERQHVVPHAAPGAYYSEDGFSVDEKLSLRYGHREDQGRKLPDKVFQPDLYMTEVKKDVQEARKEFNQDKTGCTYRAVDEPGVWPVSGCRKVAMDFRFVGQLIDTCDGLDPQQRTPYRAGEVMDMMQWTVRGESPIEADWNPPTGERAAHLASLGTGQPPAATALPAGASERKDSGPVVVQRKSCVTGRFTGAGAAFRTADQKGNEPPEVAAAWDGTRGLLESPFAVEAEFKPAGKNTQCGYGMVRLTAWGVATRTPKGGKETEASIQVHTGPNEATLKGDSKLSVDYFPQLGDCGLRAEIAPSMRGGQAGEILDGKVYLNAVLFDRCDVAEQDAPQDRIEWWVAFHKVVPESVKPQSPAAQEVKAGSEVKDAAEKKACVTGRFTSIPSGTLRFMWSEKQERLERPFQMHARFEPVAGGTDCTQGEYRQFVHAQPERDGKAVTEAEEGAREGMFRRMVEDRWGADVYGHRATNFLDGYGADGKSCLYQNVDVPTMKQGNAKRIKTQVRFLGQLIDLCRVDRPDRDDPYTDGVLAQSSWMLEGEHEAVQAGCSWCGPSSKPSKDKKDKP